MRHGDVNDPAIEQLQPRYGLPSCESRSACPNLDEWHCAIEWSAPHGGDRGAAGCRGDTVRPRLHSRCRRAHLAGGHRLLCSRCT